MQALIIILGLAPLAMLNKLSTREVANYGNEVVQVLFLLQPHFAAQAVGHRLWFEAVLVFDVIW